MGIKTTRSRVFLDIGISNVLGKNFPILSNINTQFVE